MMKIRLGLFVIITLNSLAAESEIFKTQNHSVSFPTHCKPGETPYLNAKMKKVSYPSKGGYELIETGKVLSLCTNAPQEPFSNMVYRFGKPGKVELENTATASNKFIVESLSTGPRMGENTISFTIGEYTYRIAEATGQGSGISLDVIRNSKKLVRFHSGISAGEDFQSNLMEIDFTSEKSSIFDTPNIKKTVASQAYSWGGKLRSAPSTNAQVIGSLNEKQAITVLSETNEQWNNYPWFKIRVSGKEGYHWGGIICDKSRAKTTFC